MGDGCIELKKSDRLFFQLKDPELNFSTKKNTINIFDNNKKLLFTKRFKACCSINIQSFIIVGSWMDQFF